MTLTTTELKGKIKRIPSILKEGETITLIDDGIIIGEIVPKNNETPILKKLKGILKGNKILIEKIRENRIAEKYENIH